MNFYSQDSYKNLESELLKDIKLGSNSVLLSVPGLGISYFLKKFVERNKGLGISYISQSGEKLSKFNILDLDFDKSESALITSDEYFKKADLNQKLAVVVNTPSILYTPTYGSSLTSGHVYSIYYFKVRNVKDTALFAREINNSLSDTDVDKIYDLSGGIGILIKYFAINKEKISLGLEIMLEDPSLTKVISQTIKVISDMSDSDLSQLGLKSSDKYTSKVLDTYFKTHPLNLKPQILINKDFSFEENGELSYEKLTKIEKEVLDYTLQNQIIEREKISEFKWGEGKYDKFSDQAINKTIQRINAKLQNYRLVSISKLGYKLESC